MQAIILDIFLEDKELVAFSFFGGPFTSNIIFEGVLTYRPLHDPSGPIETFTPGNLSGLGLQSCDTCFHSAMGMCVFFVVLLESVTI